MNKRTDMSAGLVLAAAVWLVAAGAGVAQAPTPEPLVNSLGMKFVLIRAGTFLFGGKDIVNENLFWKPQGFKVTMDRDYYLGVDEVTQKQYDKVMGSNPSAFVGKNRPVECVSWEEATEFCRRLSALEAEKQAGRVYALPSEREWQFAARAGSEYLFPYGSDDETRISEVAVCRDAYTDAMPAATAPVGSKQPNALGLYDMLGNVWEWCLDAQPLFRVGRDNQNEAAAGALFNISSSNVVADKGEGRVIVGGGWDNDFRACNLAARYGAYPTRKANNIGFRVRCTVQDRN